MSEVSNGVFKAESIEMRDSWKGIDQVELVVFRGVTWQTKNVSTPSSTAYRLPPTAYRLPPTAYRLPSAEHCRTAGGVRKGTADR
ncbi:hypothetical protein [Streptomyces vastus]|uniref:Uncharacterized protein n=1 Tax=Streptomyces vastus TaxID=285451 RepID=A0ABN3RN15_9ACTN